MSTILKQHLNTHKQQLRTLGLQIIIHHTHAPVHKQSHRWGFAVPPLYARTLRLIARSWSTRWNLVFQVRKARDKVPRCMCVCVCVSGSESA
jgi:hypothetical protein